MKTDGKFPDPRRECVSAGWNTPPLLLSVLRSLAFFVGVFSFFLFFFSIPWWRLTLLPLSFLFLLQNTSGQSHRF